MAYIAPIHRPNSARHAIRAHVFPDEEDCLVVAKTNRLEFWKVDRHVNTLVLAETMMVNGVIAMVQKMRPKDVNTDMLFVGTDRFQYFSMLWNPESATLETRDSYFDVNEKFLRDSQSQDKCITDPTGRFMVLLLWEGVINVLRAKKTKAKGHDIDWMDQIRIRELFIKSATFLHAETGHPKLAFVYQTRTDVPDSYLVTYRLFTDDRNTEISRFDKKDQIETMEIPDAGHILMIPVGKGEEEQKRYIVRDRAQARAQLGGLIIVGETRLMYYDDAAQKTVHAPLREASIFVAWAEYDASHYFVGDDYGNLWMLEILLQGAVVTGMEMTKLGTTSRATNLVFMGNNLLFVASHYGDSQIWRVDLHSNEPLTLVPEPLLENIAPVLDFNIMDLGNREGDGQTTNEYSSGQARLVTGSGVWKDGSLRSVRSGVGLEDVGILTEMEGIRSLFSVRSGASAQDDTLIVSLLTETRVFLFDQSGEIEEVETFKGLQMKEQTLLIHTLPNHRLLQVTPTGAYLLDLEDGIETSNWRPEEGCSITNASAAESSVLLSIDGQSLVTLGASQQDLTLLRQQQLEDGNQVACIHVPPQLPNIAVVGFWKSGSISIVDMATLEPLHGESLRRKDDNTSVPRDLALAQILPPDVSGPTLFVSMDDGFVISFSVSRTDFSLSARKSVVLGLRHARLQLLERADSQGVFNVFATSEHPSLIYASWGRIVYSMVTAEDASCVCAFDTAAFPGALAVATDDVVKISAIDQERRTHQRVHPMGRTVRRLAYSRPERVFGLGCVGRELVAGEEVITSVFRLVDEVVFEPVGRDFVLDGGGGGGGAGTEMIESVVRAELLDSYGARVERFLVGTSFLTEPGTTAGPDEYDGRILVLGIDSERNPYLVGQRRLKGACRCLAVIKGGEDGGEDYVVAALAKTVVVYRYQEVSSTKATLDKVAAYRPATYPVDLAVEGNTIAVADLMKSMSLVEFTPPGGTPPGGQSTSGGSGSGDGKAKLTETGRHFHAGWATAVCHVEGNEWLEADAQGNLLVLRRDEQGVTEEDRRRLEVTSEASLGEMVNRIRKVKVDETTEGAVVTPRAFLGTVEGGIYLFGTVAPNQQDLLLRFQARLADAVAENMPGSLLWGRYRAFRNEEREAEAPFRFVDGEMVERFLDLDEEVQGEVCRGLGPDVEEMRTLVEGLRRLH